MRDRLIHCDARVARWRVTPHPVFTVDQKDWLTRGGSLTAHLRSLGEVTVRVRRETVTQAWRDEVAMVQIAQRAPVWVREVVLEVDQAPFVVAHSVAPLAASRGVWRAIRWLAARPLAELLYSDSSVVRSVLTSARIPAYHPLFALAYGEIAGHVPHSLMARRSVFIRQGAPLLVTECMLPALWACVARCAHRTPVVKNG